jgi:peptide/nickel transport system permease protein
MEGTRARIIRSFLKHRLGMFGLVVLIVLYLVMLFASFLAPYDFTATHRNFIYAPPTRIRVVDAEGNWRAPFVYPLTKARDPVTYQLVFAEDTSRVVPVKLFVRGEEYKFLGIFKTNLHLFGVEESPDSAMVLLFGADRFGRDVFSRVLVGSQVSLTVGLLGTFLSVFIGAVVGSLSGYYGGWTDIAIQRLTELLRSFPRIPLWLALAVIVPPSWPSTWVYFGIVTVLSLIGWMGVARVMRGMTLSLREKEFVLAAKVSGVPGIKIITRHLIPNTLSYLIVVSTLSIPGMILGESTISFLGLGIKEPMTSWGLLLKQAQSLSELQSHPWLMVPGLFIMIAVLSFNFVGDALRDAVDPYRTVEKV